MPASLLYPTPCIYEPDLEQRLEALLEFRFHDEMFEQRDRIAGAVGFHEDHALGRGRHRQKCRDQSFHAIAADTVARDGHDLPVLCLERGGVHTGILKIIDDGKWGHASSFELRE